MCEIKILLCISYTVYLPCLSVNIKAYLDNKQSIMKYKLLIHMICNLLLLLLLTHFCRKEQKTLLNFLVYYKDIDHKCENRNKTV